MSNQKAPKTDGKKRIKVSQSEFPRITLEKSLRVANAIWENFAGKGAAPHEIAVAVDMSPTSGPWRSLCGSSIAYGLTEGGYAASEILLKGLGRRIVAPEEDGDDHQALVDALLEPTIMRVFFEKYDKAKFPKDEIARNVLVGMGLPKERSEKALEILKANGELCGVIVDTKTGPFVALGSPSPRIKSDAAIVEEYEEDEEEVVDEKVNQDAPSGNLHTPDMPPQVGNRVFITHGKNNKILDQVKEIVKFGKFEAVVSQENETVSKPVPQKIMNDMRTCQAGVIHIGSEGTLLDENGNQVPRINGNVLIEIGAAMALYKGNFVLLVEEGLELPSNLQGLYECRYKGDELGTESTMKLLKAFNDFK